MNLDQDVDIFSAIEVPEYLKKVLKAYGRRYAGISIELSIANSPRMIGRIHSSGDHYSLEISSGWIKRTALVFQLIESMWDTRNQRSKVYAVNIQNAFDAHFFFLPDNPTGNFLAVPDLAPLFIDRMPLDEHRSEISRFAKKFNKYHGQSQLDWPKDEPLLPFHLPEVLTSTTKKNVRLCMKFLMLHEIFHIARKHNRVLGSSEFSILSETGFLGEFDEYARKACELDADENALLVLMSEVLCQPTVDLKALIHEVLKSIYIFISCFDLSRLSIREYQGHSASHPMPDIRAYYSVFLVVDKISKKLPGIQAIFRQAHEDAVEYVVRSFQQLAIPIGAFYVIANRLMTIDRQFMPEVAVCALINDEIDRIRPYYEKIGFLNGECPTAADWSYLPFKLSDDKFREKAKEEVARILVRKDNQLEEEGFIERVLDENMRNIQLELGMSVGDHLLLRNDLERGSPYLENSESADERPNGSREEPANTEYNRIMSLAMSLLFRIAEVEIPMRPHTSV